MFRPLLVLALGLMAFASLAPAVEAALPCEEACPGEAQDGECSLALCCSCCVHLRMTCPPPAESVGAARRATDVSIDPLDSADSPDPREILHVPKPLLR